MEVGGHLAESGMKATMSPDYRFSKHLRNWRITRVVFGLVLSALATLLWLRMDVPQLWPKLLDAVHVDTVDRVEIPKVNLGKPAQRTSPVMVSSDSEAAAASSLSAVDVGCLSRSQQYKYRKKEYHFPVSGALTRALAKYTRMHSQCAWNLADVEEQADDVGHDGKVGCQYVVYREGYEGVGNRLLSLVTAFTYALVTNRTLVMDATRGHLAQLLCEPFRNSNSIKENNNNNTTWLLPSQVAYAVRQQAMTLEEAEGTQFVNVTSVHVNLRHEQTVGDRKFFCSEAQQALQNVTWVVWESNQYYVPRLFMLPGFWATLHPWFPDVSRVFTQLGRVLCVPRNAVWDTIQHVHGAQMAWATVQVGIQVRRHGVSDNASFSEAVYKRIMACVNGVVPKRGTTVAVLVTSLQSAYWETMRERWNGGSEVKFVMVSHEGTEQYSFDQARKAMVEMWLLSLCNDALATSSWSTFGYVAQALAGIRPRILNIRGAHPETEPLPACSRGQSPEPCLHYPFTAAMTAACPHTRGAMAAAPPNATVSLAPPQQQHALWVTRHIRTCQDENRGLQLVSR